VGWTTRVQFLAWARNFSLCHNVQTSPRAQIGSGAHPVSCPKVTRGSFPGNKAAGA